MMEFLNKPYRFELRDEYTKGPNPRPSPTIKALLLWEARYAESSRTLLPQHTRGIQLRQSEVLIAPSDRP